MNSLSTFLTNNKVLLVGLALAVATALQQVLGSGPMNVWVLVWAGVVAAIGFLANNLHGEVATILTSLTPTAGIIYQSTQNNATISWPHILLAATVAVLGAITGPAKAATKASIIILLVCLGSVCNAQSPFKAEPKVIQRVNAFARAAVAQPDSLTTVWRFSANLAAYSYTLGNGGGSSALSGMEYGMQRQKWNYTTNSWDVLWTVNAAWFPINTALPVTLANIQTFGLTFGFKNPIPIGNSIIQLGPDFNPHAPKNQQFGVLATVGILLN